MSVRQIDRFLEQWRMDARDLHRRLILAPTPRERERWRAIWLLAQGWTASGTAQALGRDPHTIGRWAWTMGCGLWRGRACRLDFRAVRGFPPALGERQQADLKAAAQELPAMAGIELAKKELEGGPSVCSGAVRHQPEPQRLPDPVSSTG